MKQRTHEGFLRHKNFLFAQVATALCVIAVGVYFRKDRVLTPEPFPLVSALHLPDVPADVPRPVICRNSMGPP